MPSLFLSLFLNLRTSSFNGKKNLSNMTQDLWTNLGGLWRRIVSPSMKRKWAPHAPFSFFLTMFRILRMWRKELLCSFKIDNFQANDLTLYHNKYYFSFFLRKSSCRSSNQNNNKTWTIIFCYWLNIFRQIKVRSNLFKAWHLLFRCFSSHKSSHLDFILMKRF